MRNLNLAESEDVQQARSDISSIEERIRFSKVFKKLYESPEFKEVVLDTMLGKEVRAKAETLALNPYMDKEQEEETLVVLRAMRYLNKFITDKLRDAELAPSQLEESQEYLQQKLAEQKENL